MAIKFGSALKVALQVEADGWSLLQMEPERIFRAVTAVSESELRQALARDFASIEFKYVNMKLVPDDTAEGRIK